MIDYLSNQSNHCKTYETLVNMGFSGDCFRVRFSHPLLLRSLKAFKIKAFRLFCFARKGQGTTQGTKIGTLTKSIQKEGCTLEISSTPCVIEN